jgi:hypothetical protein
MVESKGVRTSLGMILALAGVWLSACTANLPGITTPTVTVRSETGERASGQAVDAIVSGVAGVYNRAIQSSGSGPQSVSGILGGGLGPSATLPAACDGVVLRYFNAQGQQQSAYDGATTTRITGVGTCSTNYGPVTLDITADDVLASSSTVLLNGTAQGTYTGSLVRGTVSNVRMSKQFCGAPAGGTITATMDALTATIKFNGTLNPVGTYTWNGIGVSFTVPMQPCS